MVYNGTIQGMAMKSPQWLYCRT